MGNIRTHPFKSNLVSNYLPLFAGLQCFLAIRSFANATQLYMLRNLLQEF